MLRRRTLLLASLLAPTVGATALALDGRLANGLRYRVVQWPGLRTARLHLAYGSGSRHDPANRQGLSHLLEHAMFKAELEPGLTADAWLRSRGLEGMAYTTHDSTVFHCEAPVSLAAEVLEMEARRMQRVVLTAPALEAEKAVVLAEVASKDAEFRAEMALAARCLASTTYAQDLAGVPAHLQDVALAQVLSHHQTHYVPSNAFVVVVADATLAQMTTWVEAAFAAVNKPGPDWEAHANWHRAAPAFVQTASQKSLALSWEGARLWESSLADYWQEWVPRVLGPSAKPWTLSYEHTGRQVVVVPRESGSTDAQVRQLTARLRRAAVARSHSQGLEKSVELARRMRLQQADSVAESAIESWLAARTPAPARQSSVGETLAVLLGASPQWVLL